MSWQAVKQTISTPWTDQVSPTNALPEYPRPQMVRSAWLNLNGLWDYALEAIPFEPLQGLTDKPSFTKGNPPDSWDGQILVPFAIDSPLSGVMKILRPDQRLWYRRTVSVPDDWIDKRILLHFQAADWETSIYLNGVDLGQHRGGYDPFSIDLTEHFRSGDNEIIVCCWDATEHQSQALGKQILPEDRKGFRYQPTGGIWQTVWLEAVPDTYIQSLHITPDVDNSLVHIQVQGEGLAGSKIRVTALVDNQDISHIESDSSHMIDLQIPDPMLWNPDTPFLYDLRVDVIQADTVIDSVTSYFGMRKITMGEDENGIVRILLNDQYIFQLGPLDQGYWPDGILTPPSEEAILFDLKYLKRIACNMVRVHIKVHPDRWYYHCDRLGLLVWQDMVSMPKFNQTITPTVAQQWESELTRMMDWLHNHPSIIQWIVFNEAWGQHNTNYYVERVKEQDSSRLVTNASGWTDVPVGDIYDIHDYTFYPATASQTIANGRAILLGEVGGFNACISNHNWYSHEKPSEVIDYVHDITRSTYPTKQSLEESYRFWIDNLRCLLTLSPVNGLVYTQITDVEHELNGWLTYDRQVSKIPQETLKELHDSLFKPIRFSMLLDDETIWKIGSGEHITKPILSDATAPETQLPDFSGEWCQLDFDDSSWESRQNSFEGGVNVQIEAVHDSPYLYLRTNLFLDEIPENPAFHVVTSADCQLFINGKLIRSLRLRPYSAPISETCTLLCTDEMSQLRLGDNIVAAVLLPSSQPPYLEMKVIDVSLQ
jgi:hypothetical protein